MRSVNYRIHAIAKKEYRFDYQLGVGAGRIFMFPTTRPAMNGFENQDPQPA
jgi:hypothetical protein